MNHPTVTIETLEKYEKEFRLKSTP
jgi:hypothetical protein